MAWKKKQKKPQQLLKGWWEMHAITFNTRIQVKTDAHVFFWVIERHIVIYNITPHFLSWYYYYHHLDLIFFFFFEKKERKMPYYRQWHIFSWFGSFFHVTEILYMVSLITNKRYILIWIKPKVQDMYMIISKRKGHVYVGSTRLSWRKWTNEDTKPISKSQHNV